MVYIKKKVPKVPVKMRYSRKVKFPLKYSTFRFDFKKYQENYEKIFGKKDEKKIQDKKTD